MFRTAERTADKPLPSRLFPSNMALRKRERVLDGYVQAVHRLLDHLSEYADDELADHLLSLRNEGVPGDQEHVIGNFICAAAIGTETIRRTLGFQLHDVQIRGALAAASGSIIEMQTGEGKTVVCGLAALIRSIFDQSVHVATTTDYLAERDHESVEPVFRLLKTSSAVIRLDFTPSETRAAYRCNITYGPGYLFGFDYLRDQILLMEENSITMGRDVLMSIHGRRLEDELAQPLHQSIIVDEADSVLIDESTTPLILSGNAETETDPEILKGYLYARDVVETLIQGKHFELNEISRTVELTEEGMSIVHQELESFGRMELLQPWPVYIRNALFAKFLLIRDEHYVVQNGEIQLVDQNTGRIFEDRTLRGGLHQAVEASEGLDIRPPGRTLARVTRQRFFQLYHTICGMTGTASGSEKELKHFYRSPVVPIARNRANRRIELPERFFSSRESKLKAIAEDVRRRRPTGQPVLIGTRTIRESLLVEEMLKSIGIRATILNGVQDADEARIISEAGQVGAVTIATNMAGRGTDIKLSPAARQLGGLHVIATQRNSSRRVDRQLAGRSARQGDPGSAQFFLSADDDLFQKHGPGVGDRMMANACVDGESHKDFSADVARLQEKIEKEQFEMRRRLVRQDGWMDQVRNTMVNDQSG